MKTVLFAALCAGVLATASAQADEDVKRILDRGRDGDVNYYQVMCTNGTIASVTVTDTPAQACAQPLGGPEVCSATWTLNEAAVESCK